MLTGRFKRIKMKIAPTIREIRVASAAPAAPMLKPKIKIAFPPTLIQFMMMEIVMETLEFPIARNNAAPAL